MSGTGTASGSESSIATAADQVLDSLDLTSSFSNTKSNSLVTASIGKLSVTLKSTYRLASTGSDDVLVSELEIQNVDSKTITLPNPTDTSFYGGYRMGDLNAKIPYTTTAVDGYIYLGDGTWNPQAAAWSARMDRDSLYG